MNPQLPESWKPVLESSGLSTTEIDTPIGESSEWLKLQMRFGTRGFTMLHARSDADTITWRATLSLPIPEESAGLASLLAEQLQDLGATESSVTHAGPPATVIASFPATLGEEGIQRVVLTTLRAADYVQALELDSSAPNPLLTPATNTRPEEPTAPASTSSAFEQIGDDTPAPREQAPAAPTSGFEQIGPGTTRPTSTTASVDSLALVDHLIDSSGRDVDVHFIFSDALDATLRRALEDALSRTTATRFDAYVELAEPREATDRSVHMILAPAISTADERDVDALRQDCVRFARRLREFGELGVSLAELIELDRPAPRARSTRTETTHTDDAPRRGDAPASESGFVLDLGGSSSSERDDEGETELGMPARSAGLTAGDFTDPRLRRDDSTADLVDVVLRHPGYSDKNISKVLSILLSIEYSKALMLAQSAPCVIAWGIGQERALTMKNVIESGGGRVVLVEPDTFAPS